MKGEEVVIDIEIKGIHTRGHCIANIETGKCMQFLSRFNLICVEKEISTPNLKEVKHSSVNCNIISKVRKGKELKMN